MNIKHRDGKISFFRINEYGGYGAPDDFIDAEVIIKFENDPQQAYGLALKPNDKLPAAQAMCSLLQDAFNANAPVGIEFDERPGKNHHYLFRVMRPS